MTMLGTNIGACELQQFW